MQIRTIAFYHWVFPAGGAETVTCNLGRFFAAQGYRQIVYTWKLLPDLLTDPLRTTFDIRQLPDTSRCSSPENTDYICESLEKEQVDILFIQGSTDIAIEAIRARTPAKIIFCLHNTPFWEIYDLKHKKASEIPHATWKRKLEFTCLRKPAYWLTDKLEQRFTKLYARIVANVDRFVTLCPGYSEELERRIRRSQGFECPPDRLAAVLNPMLPVPESQETAKEQIVLYVGRFQRIHKRTDRLLKIWHRIERRNPGWRLVLVGDGEDRENLEKETRRLKLQRVEFAGYQNDVASYYRRAAFVCLTSNFEGLPMCLMEGQQYGAIPVSFDSYAGIREIARDGESGIVVPAFDLGEYARRLDAAMNDQALQRRMRENSLRAAERYDLERIGAEWLLLFDEL